MKKPIPESRVSRAGIVGKAVIHVGARHVGHKVKRPFLSKETVALDKARLHDKNAAVVFNALVQLRGTALKMAQLIGMELDFLPEQYRRELEKSYHQVPPLNRVLVVKALRDAFGRSVDDVFLDFDSQAFAAASLGQVHRAILPDATEVAVKIQYPGIHVALENDIDLLYKAVRTLPNRSVLEESLEEIRSRLLEEVDYLQEADNTVWFRNHLQSKNIFVPRVFHDYSGDRILTTEYCIGKHLDQWLADNPSQSARNRAGQALYDLFVESVLQLQRLHADPNPGNYLFAEDGSVTLIDFGCVKRLSPTFVSVLPRLLNAYRRDDPDGLICAYKELGMEYDNEAVYESLLKPFGQWLTLPFQGDSFDFAKHSDYTRQARNLLRDIAKLSGVNKLAGDFVFFDRSIYGMYKIFEKLGATIRMRHHWEGL